jgi:glycosyltransferase involved in cell wall biosynthesis
MPLHSIIMPTFNGEQYIAEAIQSILNQTFNDFELIIVDDCSTDNTLSILEKFKNDSRVNFFSTPTNSGGPAAPKNIGLSKSSGKIISFCDQDDLLLPDKLSRASLFFEKNPDFDVVFFDYVPIDENIKRGLCYLKEKNFLQRAKDYLEPIESDSYFCKRFYGCMAGIDTGMTTQTVLCNHTVFEKIRFDTRYRIVDDIAVWYRIAENFKIGFIDSPAALYRHHDLALTKNRKLLISETVTFHRENYFRQEQLFNSEEKLRYKKMLARFFIRAASASGISSFEERTLLLESLIFDFRFRTLRWFLQTFILKKHL